MRFPQEAFAFLLIVWVAWVVQGLPGWLFAQRSESNVPTLDAQPESNTNIPSQQNHPHHNPYQQDQAHAYSQRHQQQSVDSPKGLIQREDPDYLRQLGVRPLHEFQLSSTLIASDVEGGLHALNRDTGEIMWSLEVEDPLVQVHTNFSDGEPSETDDTVVWIVEPYGDGNLYYFNKQAGLNKLPVSISHLVLQSPFAMSGDDKVYTGVRKSSLYTIDVTTGEILSTYGANSKLEDDVCSSTSECANLFMLGKTTYELTIHGKDNTYWNVTYSSWGPNNIDSDLAFQNKIPLDGTYIAPFHDSTLLAIDINSKAAKWVSQLPFTAVNVFDILHDERLAEIDSSNYIIVPHPLKPPSGFGEPKQQGTYLDTTMNGSWYAMSSEFYPSLVQSAPTSRYSLSERWRASHILNSPQHFNTAVVGVHFPTTTSSDDGYPTGVIVGYPTNFPQNYPPNAVDYNTQTPYRSNELGTYNPPSRSEWIGLPSASAPSNSQLLGIDPAPRKVGFFDTSFGRVLHKLISFLISFVLVSILVFIAYTYIRDPDYRYSWRAAASSLLNNMLRKVGLQISELEETAVTGAKLSEKDINKAEVSSQDNEGNDSVHAPGLEVSGPTVSSDFEDNNLGEVSDDTVTSNSLVERYVSPHSEPDTTNTENGTEIATGPPLKVKKEVTIVEPPADQKMSTDKANGGLKKRKRGSRGGKKSKKNSMTEIKEELLEQESAPSANDSPVTPTSVVSTPKVNGLTLSKSILGYGSYGTVVFKGTFQNRDVAVKRMLIDFYDVASHEIKLLTESDDHPNVIRYFYSETNDKFLYIALELCSASLEDVIEKSEDFPELMSLMNPVNVLEQVANGLHHLHSLKIVHRDIKPQNILVAPPKKLKSRNGEFSPVRILISDFGLCKLLEADESSFRATTQHAAGTSGWRAPELLVDETNTTYNSISMSSDHSFNTSTNSIAEPLVFDSLSKRRLTRAIDIFSLGCVFYYILSNGSHPFGDRYLREGNVIKGECCLDALDILPDNVVEAKDLISKMIARDPKLRPNTDQVLKHPYFWSDKKKLEFLLKVSDRYEIEQRDPPSELLNKLEAVASEVIGADWCRKFERVFMDNLGKYRKYHGTRLMDLLRALRNKYHHFNDLPPDLVTKMSPLPGGFYQYFNKKFPNLLMKIYKVVGENLSDDHVLETFL